MTALPIEPLHLVYLPELRTYCEPEQGGEFRQLLLLLDQKFEKPELSSLERFE